MNQSHKLRQFKANNLVEGLRRADLTDTIDPLFTVDQFQSKMGNDQNIIVLRFRAVDKEPAIDLMEFIEKGYSFVLDADISSGEERDGKYSIFVELERSEEAPEHISDLLNGISQLCNCENWRFRWYKDIEGHNFSKEDIAENIPLTPEEYKSRVNGSDTAEVVEFFDQGALDSITIENDRSIVFRKPYAESLKAKLVAIGDYAVLKHVLEGGLQLDESSRSQVVYLNKYLGNYDINKIEGHFLIRNGNRAVIISKEKW